MSTHEARLVMHKKNTGPPVSNHKIWIYKCVILDLFWRFFAFGIYTTIIDYIVNKKIIYLFFIWCCKSQHREHSFDTNQWTNCLLQSFWGAGSKGTLKSFDWIFHTKEFLYWAYDVVFCEVSCMGNSASYHKRYIR